MRLVTFIRENAQDIIREWESFAFSLKSSEAPLGSLSLRDHIEGILAFIADDIESLQTGAEQIKKSHGNKPRALTSTAAETHAAIRLAGGFDLDQMVSEYRALRASVIKLWGTEATEYNDHNFLDLIRFNEAIDQELTESISHYTKKVTQSKDLFLGILAHDLLTPLGAASMSAQLMPKIGVLDERQAMLGQQVVNCIERGKEIIVNLLDLTRARFGSGLPLSGKI